MVQMNPMKITGLPAQSNRDSYIDTSTPFNNGIVEGINRGISFTLSSSMDNTASRPFVEWRLNWTLPQINNDYTLVEVVILERVEGNTNYTEKFVYSSPFESPFDRSVKISDRFYSSNSVNRFFTPYNYYKVRLKYDHDESADFENYNSTFLFSKEHHFVSKGLGLSLIHI